MRLHEIKKCTAKEATTRVKRQPTDGRKKKSLPTMYQMGLILKIHKQMQKLSTNKTKSSDQ